jgi:methylmalonyl-CoA mutase N-terminal domain/subunit
MAEARHRVGGGAQEPRRGGGDRALDALKRGAAGTENTMPLLIDCVKAYCTVGEISDALREVFGTYVEPPVF